jgi:elongator complex protein 3
MVNKDNILFGLLRLRIAQGKAIVRELHIYGKALEIGMKGKKSSQHTGLGKVLLKEAEKIVRKAGIKELKIISGVGVRDYYRKLGYRLKGPYVVKKLR